MITAEIDPLRSEGEAYAMLLQEAGVDVTYQNFDGVTHEFFGMVAVLEQSREAVNLAAEELAAAFGDDAEATPIEEVLGGMEMMDAEAMTDTEEMTDTEDVTETRRT